MRNAFADELTTLAREDDRIVVLSGDIGNRLFDRFKEIAPDRFFNCGVAEANMTGMAAGLALCELKPITYTIAPFVTTRCLEQIRVDICYPRLPVVIVGVGAGLSYAGLGATHHSCEDIALMRVLPEMSVVCPGDATEVRMALRAATQHNGPVYLRLGKKGEPCVHEDLSSFEIGKSIPVCRGEDVCFLSTGNMLPVAVEASKELAGHGLSVRVESFHTVKPLDEQVLREVFERIPLVVTIEEHSRLGGLGGSIAEWLTTQSPFKARLLIIGTEDCFLHEAGPQAYARERFELTAGLIAKKTLDHYRSIQVL